MSFLDYIALQLCFARSNFATFPGELRESAQLDGANDWTILSRIYLPLSKPILATLTLFIGVGKWNDWFTGASIRVKAALYPAATVLQKILSKQLLPARSRQDRKHSLVM